MKLGGLLSRDERARTDLLRFAGGRTLFDAVSKGEVPASKHGQPVEKHVPKRCACP